MRYIQALLLLVVAALPGATVPAQQAGNEAAHAVGATLEVEQDLLQEDLARHARLAQERNALLRRLEDLYRSLDTALHRTDVAAADILDELTRQIERSEQAHADTLDTERLLIERIRDRARRLELLQIKLDELESDRAGTRGPLDGEWSVVLLPNTQTGIFTLSQSGTLVSGTYRLEGDWSGSLQGTLVDRKVRLIRIDSKLGRSMEFEGYLSADLNEIKGNWQSYEMADGSSPSGQWTARRRSAEP